MATINASEKVGKDIVYAGKTWRVLDVFENGAFILAKDCWFNYVLSQEGNNWAESTLRKEMNAVKDGKFTHEELKDINPDDLVSFKRDLTTDDGLDKYGSCEDLISMYTAQDYRKYRKVIPDCKTWHWTITADSLVFEHAMRCVSPFGYLNHYNCGSGIGVRPFCILKSNIFESCVVAG